MSRDKYLPHAVPIEYSQRMHPFLDFLEPSWLMTKKSAANDYRVGRKRETSRKRVKGFEAAGSLRLWWNFGMRIQSRLQ
jgi:hypothetical protein